MVIALQPSMSARYSDAMKNLRVCVCVCRSSADIGWNEESGECVCNTSSNCLASFNFTSLEECQDNIKGEAEPPSPTLFCKKDSSNHSSNSICLPSPIQSRLVIRLSVPMCGVALYCSTLLRVGGHFWPILECDECV